MFVFSTHAINATADMPGTHLDIACVGFIHLRAVNGHLQCVSVKGVVESAATPCTCARHHRRRCRCEWWWWCASCNLIGAYMRKGLMGHISKVCIVFHIMCEGTVIPSTLRRDKGFQHFPHISFEWPTNTKTGKRQTSTSFYH
eukprot:365303-Chlamydomonas_euryale.AAC.52